MWGLGVSPSVGVGSVSESIWRFFFYLPMLLFAYAAWPSMGRVCSVFNFFYGCKITIILRSCFTGLEKTELPWEPNFTHRCVVRSIIRLPSFNGVCFKLTEIYILDVMLRWVYGVITPLICMFYSIFKRRYVWNQCRYVKTVNGVWNLSWNSIW